MRHTNQQACSRCAPPPPFATGAAAAASHAAKEKSKWPKCPRVRPSVMRCDQMGDISALCLLSCPAVPCVPRRRCPSAVVTS